MELFSVSLRGINLPKSTVCTLALALVSSLLCGLLEVSIKVWYLRCIQNLKTQSSVEIIQTFIMLYPQAFVGIEHISNHET
jgi:hypothetical protein